MEVGQGSEPCTGDLKEVVIPNVYLNNCPVALLDTIGFNHPQRDDMNILQSIANWLTS